MAAKKKPVIESGMEAPEKLERFPFYTLELDDDQWNFVQEIWNKDNDIIFCNAAAGTGKTLCAIATANLLVQYGLYEGIVYIVSPTQEQKIGFLPGEVESKIEPYIAPLYDALVRIGVNPDTSIVQSSVANRKSGSGYIEAISHLYLRGCNLENKVVICDETQNFYLDELKKTLTRVHDNSKTIVIGHSGQCDLFDHPERSGFVKYMDYFRNQERCSVCELKTNHRGWVANYADSLPLQ